MTLNSVSSTVDRWRWNCAVIKIVFKFWIKVQALQQLAKAIHHSMLWAMLSVTCWHNCCREICWACMIYAVNTFIFHIRIEQIAQVSKSILVNWVNQFFLKPHAMISILRTIVRRWRVIVRRACINHSWCQTATRHAQTIATSHHLVHVITRKIFRSHQKFL